MRAKIQLSGTIVLYNENVNELKKAIDSFLAIPVPKKLFLIDNSSSDDLRYLNQHPEIHYRFSNNNIGFGAGHNEVINDIRDLSTYHLILNPDVIFKPEDISKLIKELQYDNTLAMVAPRVLYPNGAHQITARRYPKPLDLILRRIKINSNRLADQEYRNYDLKQAFYPDFIHGCFMLFKTSVFIKLNGFDTRYFLYMEDVDICKKIDDAGFKKLYYPKIEIIHIKQQGSAKKLNLLYHHLSSAIKYFIKWGVK